MKIFVIRVENPEIKIEIKLEEYSLVRNIRNKLDKIFPGRVKWNKHFIKLVHKNIIMDDEKSIGWYKLCEGDEILCVRIENYLCSDDVILEVFLSGFVPEVIYLIVQRNYSISKIKSMIERIQCEIINICDFTGNKMTGSQTVTETSSCAYYRLIVKYGRKETCISTFEDCLKQYHKFRIIHYYDFILRLRHLYECLFETRINEVIKQMNEIKAIMLSNDPFEIRLKENLSEFPSAFIKCHSIFCDDISSRIWDICDDYWQLSRNVIENDEWIVIGLFFRMALLIVLHQYLEHERNHCEIATKTFNSIVVDALGYSVTLLIKIRQMESFCETAGYSFDLIGELMEDICVKWMDPFLSTSRYYSEFDEVFNRYYNKTFASLKFGNGSVEFHFHSDPQTIIEAKEAMAQKCGVKVNDLYAIYQRNEDKPTDGEPYDETILDFVLMINMENFDFLKEFATGAFGKVFICQDKISSQELVLKKSTEMEFSLHRDIFIGYRLKNSSKLFQYSRIVKDMDSIQLAMPYLSGGSLTSKIQQQKCIHENEKIKISYQILTQIHELHRLQIVHRDIKPDNIILDGAGNAKLIDFGLSKSMENVTIEILLEKLKAYAPGTVNYMAPEILREIPYSYKIDIWSFGMVLVEMVTGNPPFHKKAPPRVVIELKKMVEYEFKPNLLISIEFNQFIKWCLTVDPNERPSAQQLIESQFIIDYLNINKN